MRLITQATTSRASCHLLALLLKTGRVKFTVIADTVDNMLSAVDVAGPNGNDSTILDFWRVVVRFKNKENVSSLVGTSSVLLAWLGKHLSISMFVFMNPSSIGS